MNVADKMTWAIGSGALPISLNGKGENRYLLLDGGVRDYCLDLSENDVDTAVSFSDAWSSNAKNYISKVGDQIIVLNWQKNNRVSLPINVVSRKFDEFLHIVYQQSYLSEDDVVPYFINAFRQIRNYVGEKGSAKDSLYLFFKVLITLENGEDLNGIDCNKWKIEDVEIPRGFEDLASNIRKGVRGIKPNLEYILRHSAGPLFEEANREASYLDRGLNLFGGISSKLVLKRNLYSSIHYTPLYLARSLVENVVSKLNFSKKVIRVLDPSCGSATLLLEFLKQIKDKGFKGKVEVVGYDNEETAVKTAEFLLEFEKRTQWSEESLVYNVKHVDDALKENWGESDIIIMNPPFLSWNLLTKDARETVSIILSNLKMNRKPNEAAAFLYHAVDSLKRDGILGSIIPSSILIADQYNDMRKKIREKVSLGVVARLGNYVFDEALTDVGVLICTSDANNCNNNSSLNIWCRNQKGCAYEVLKEWRIMNYRNIQSANDYNYSIYSPVKFPYRGETWSVTSKSNYDFYTLLSGETPVLIK